MYGTPLDKVTEEQRGAAKAIGFGIIYGMTSLGLAARLGTDERMAAGLIEQYFAAYPKVREYREQTADEALETGRLRTSIGRIRRFEGTSLMKRYQRDAVRRAAMNFPIKGTSTDGQKLALVLLYERRDECLGAVPILAVHAEIVVECDEDQTEKAEACLKQAMVDGMNEVLKGPEVEGPCVPVEVEVKSAKTWGG